MTIRTFLNVLNRQKQRLRLLLHYDDFSIEDYFRNEGVAIGRNNRIQVRSLGTEPFLVDIGSHCTIASGVQFLTHDGATWLFTDETPDLQRFGRIRIHDNCFIGINAIIMRDVSIGPTSIVGAGAIVTRDVPPGAVAVGNPARVISTVAEYKAKVVQVWANQKPPGYFSDVSKGSPNTPRVIDQQKQHDWALLKAHLSKLL